MAYIRVHERAVRCAKNSTYALGSKQKSAILHKSKDFYALTRLISKKWRKNNFSIWVYLYTITRARPDRNQNTERKQGINHHKIPILQFCSRIATNSSFLGVAAGPQLILNISLSHGFRKFLKLPMGQGVRAFCLLSMRHYAISVLD